MNNRAGGGRRILGQRPAQLDEPPTSDQAWFREVPLRLRDDVELLQGANDDPMLFSRSNGHYTRLQPAGARLIATLNGTLTGQGLVEALATRNPDRREQVVASVSRFLSELKAADVLDVEGGAVPSRANRYTKRGGLMLRLPVFRSVDRRVQPIVRMLRRLPRRPLLAVVLAAVGLGAALAAVALLSGPLAPDPARVAWPVLLLLPLLVVLHEGAHVVALAYMGVSVNSAGLGLMMWVIPVGYVDRTDAYRVRSKRGRVAIALAGPAVDLVLAGLAGTVGLLSSGTTEATAKALMLFLTAALMFNLNPMLPTDGYHALEAAVGGLNARARGFAFLRALVTRRPLPSHLAPIKPVRAIGYLVLALGTLGYVGLIVINVVLAFRS